MTTLMREAEVAGTVDFTRGRDFFNPCQTTASATIVGAGGIGSFAALSLAKLGVEHIDVVDFDHVEAHNLPNQLYMLEQNGMSKVDALAQTVRAFAPVNVTTHEQRLQDGLPLNPVVISALDSMAARADLWAAVKNKLACKLLLDARLGGENIVLYAVRPTNRGDQEGYEATLHSDDEGVELPCTGRAIIDVGFAVASLLTRAVRRHYSDEEPMPITYLDQAALNLYTGDWHE